MKNLYSHLLSVLSNHVWDGEITSPEFAQYLQSLQPSVRKLRASYQTSIRVIVNYDDEQIQASYWLAYYPHYVQMTEKILAQLSEQGLLDRFHHQIEKQLFQTSGELNLSILAAGAIPEAVAISNYIKTHFPVEDYGTIRGHLNIHTFDLGYEEWKTKGNRHFESRHWKRAIAHYTKALEFYPHSYFSYTRRALAYRKNGEYEKAINDYTNAFSLCQGKAEDYYHRSIAYRQLEQYQCALKDCNQAIDLKPHLAPAYNHRGNLFVDLEDYDSAIENYKVALEIEPNFAIAYNNQGVAYSKLNQYQKARKSYDLAIKLNPN
ncbi:tetratricopeptide repeat protein [Dactylococcopsis salina]|uniref:Tetratricopeptide repeat protein n=1 Tax=Dactylococcopsis salina (strain PCC 8305) TaxID=13035 RepID=K9YTS2_DACS8|nr:tetratricopeptide repeat protein [Dactylococcopsis salina]AFZ49735.1 tetratricopeptide repeat protein [Dactylococcopsis salina PCC 8305]